MPYNEYKADDELAAYGAMFSSRSPVGNSTIFDSLLHRVSENRFKSVVQSKVKENQLGIIQLYEN